MSTHKKVTLLVEGHIRPANI